MVTLGIIAVIWPVIRVSRVTPYMSRMIHAGLHVGHDGGATFT